MSTALLSAVEVGVAAVAVAGAAAQHRSAPVRSPAGAASVRRRVGRRATTDRATTDWATLLDHIAAEVRTGSSLTAAIQRVDERTCTNPADAERSANVDAAVVTATLAAAVAVGGPVAATLQHGASVLRERIALRSEAEVHAAQARLSARVLTLLPLVVALLGGLTSTSFRHALASPIGGSCAAVGGVLNLIGWRWMHREIERVLA